MKYYSTNNRSVAVSFREALLNGLAADGGLYMPETIPPLEKDFLSTKNLSLQEIGTEVADKFIGDEIRKDALQNIINSSLNFVIPVFPITEDVFVMELFHGPTLAFKDVGARFMARTLSHLLQNEKKEITILTATSGDTGSAVANGFYEAEGIRVIILYPGGGVSSLQEKQMTTLGKNITAVEVEGTFDDCQSLVKRSFADRELRMKLRLTSANSINIARLIPQSFYYLYACSMMPEKENIVFSVPSGNFGNLTAGLLTKKMGMNAGFIAATNSNDTFPNFLESGKFETKPSIKTISNAMDVGNPSNFSRILSMYNNSYESIRNNIQGYSISDAETRSAIRNVFGNKNYLLDPHGAVGYAALEKYASPLPVRQAGPTPLPKERGGTVGIVLATAHPAKFREVVEEAAGIKLNLPEALSQCLKKEKSAVKLTADFNSLKEFLLYSSLRTE